MVWSVLLVLGVCKEWQECSGGWRCSDHKSWLQGCAAKQPCSVCCWLPVEIEVDIRQTPGPWATVWALGTEGLPDCISNLPWLGPALNMEPFWKIKLICCYTTCMCRSTSIKYPTSVSQAGWNRKPIPRKPLCIFSTVL